MCYIDIIHVYVQSNRHTVLLFYLLNNNLNIYF